jgi:hypothetical protein
MKYIQCFGGIGANVVDVSPEFVQANTTAFQTYVELDRKAHAAFRPGDVHDGKGGFSTPPLSEEKTEAAFAVLEGYRFEALTEIQEKEFEDRAELGDAEARARADDRTAYLTEKYDAATIAIDAAKNHHDLPLLVRDSVRGYGDDWSLPD